MAMKNLAFASAAMLAALAPVAMLAAAPGDAPRPMAVTRDMVKAEADQVWSKADLNGDGRIDAADREARMLKRFDAMDTNHDGMVSRDEYLAAIRARAKDWHGADWPEHGPGEAERKADAGPDHPAMGHEGWKHDDKGGRHHPMIAMIVVMPALHDAIKDGAVTRAAFDAAVTARFDKLDTNHDGTLDRAELRAGMPPRGGPGDAGGWRGGHGHGAMPPPPPPPGQ